MLLKKQGFAPKRMTTDKFEAYPVAIRKERLCAFHDQGIRAKNRTGNSHQPVRRRERAMAKFRSAKSLQKFASAHASIHNHLSLQRHLVRRDTFKNDRSVAVAEWRQSAI